MAKKLRDIVEGMPSGVIKHKQKLADETPEQLHSRFTNLVTRFGEKATPAKIENQARQTAWRHGYGKMSDHYWNKIKHLVKE